MHAPNLGPRDSGEAVYTEYLQGHRKQARKASVSFQLYATADACVCPLPFRPGTGRTFVAFGHFPSDPSGVARYNPAAIKYSDVFCAF